MIEDRALYSADEPHKRFFVGEAGIRVKIHAVPQSAGFGRLGWTITGSHCDGQGKAVPYAEGYAIHPDAHELTIKADADWTADERAAKIREAFDEALLVAARRVEAAVLNAQVAMDVFNGGSADAGS